MERTTATLLQLVQQMQYSNIAEETMGLRMEMVYLFLHNIKGGTQCFELNFRHFFLIFIYQEAILRYFAEETMGLKMEMV